MSDERSMWAQLAALVSVVTAITFAAMWWDARGASDAVVDARLDPPSVDVATSSLSFEVCGAMDRPLIPEDSLWSWNGLRSCFQKLTP